MRFDANMSDTDDDDVICRESIRPRKIKPQNIVCRLIERERGARRPGTHVHAIREFYKNIYPNLTIINVEKPAGFLRKFSPDGKYLIAFTFDQTSLEIYRFNGVVAAAELINVWKTDVVPNTNTDLPYGIRSQIFDKLFKVSVGRVDVAIQQVPRHLHHFQLLSFIPKLKSVVSVATSGKQLNRECSLFTNDSRYVIVGAASYIMDDNRPPFYDLYTSNDGITPTLR